MLSSGPLRSVPSKRPGATKIDVPLLTVAVGEACGDDDAVALAPIITSAGCSER